MNCESLARESNPALRLRRPPCVHHTREECPRQESNLVFDLRRVACRPAHPEGKKVVTGSEDARIRTLSASFGGSLLSQEHIPVNETSLTSFRQRPSIVGDDSLRPVNVHSM